MDPEKTYRVDHIFHPLTARQIEEYIQQLSFMEEQFLKEAERFKASEKGSKHSQNPKREPVNIEFEESDLC